VRWWFPGRFFGIPHHSVDPEWKRQMLEMRGEPNPPRWGSGGRPEN
jgi:hypothetical protein